MDSKESMNITVLIAGRPYPLKIKVSDEAVIRKIVKEINEKVNNFQLTYKQKDKQDCLAMALLTYAVDLQKANHSRMDADFSQKLDHLDQLLSSVID
ncbi:MAG: cell division protein ZapA [Bacteroidota bacterium]